MTKEQLQNEGFDGFVSINELMNNTGLAPKQKGVYVILNNTKNVPTFLPEGTGGYFKGKNPNVPVAKLQRQWIEDEAVVYIGKAGGKDNGATLQSRLKQYMDFGQGKPVGHRGGRLIWQLAEIKDFLVCWKILSAEEPEDVERQMIQDFKKEHDGRRPFANLRD